MANEVKVKLGDKDLTAYPLNFKTLREMGPFFKRMKGGAENLDMETDFDNMISMAIGSFNRHGEQVTREWLAENLDPINMPAVMSAINEASTPKGESAGEKTPTS